MIFDNMIAISYYDRPSLVERKGAAMTLLAPKVFGLDDNRQSAVRDPVGATVDCIKPATEACPQETIVVEDAETGEREFS